MSWTRLKCLLSYIVFWETEIFPASMTALLISILQLNKFFFQNFSDTKTFPPCSLPGIIFFNHWNTQSIINSDLFIVTQERILKSYIFEETCCWKEGTVKEHPKTLELEPQVSLRSIFIWRWVIIGSLHKPAPLWLISNASFGWQGKGLVVRKSSSPDQMTLSTLFLSFRPLSLVYFVFRIIWLIPTPCYTCKLKRVGTLSYLSLEFQEPRTTPGIK